MSTSSPETDSESGFVSSSPEYPLQVDVSLDLSSAAMSDTDTVPTISILALFKYATTTELLLNVVGLLAAIGGGAAMPLMSLFFGNLTKQFVQFSLTIASAKNGDSAAQAQVEPMANQFRHSAAVDASYLAYIGAGMFACTYAYMYIWTYTGELNVKRLREQYFKSVLRQDVAFFDHVGPGEVATRIQSDTHMVQRGVSEKVALAVSFASCFTSGFIIAFVRSWRLALALSVMLPCISLSSTVMSHFISKYTTLALGHVAMSGTFAEEVISAIRTTHAFGKQRVLGEIYDGFIDKSWRMYMHVAIWHGAGLGVFFFFVYGSYGLGLKCVKGPIQLIYELNLRFPADAGAVVSVFMAILNGSFALSQVAPMLHAVTDARSAAAKLYATIDRIPAIDSESKDGLKPDRVEGEITLEGVSFTYPSRPDVPILRDLSITFPAGKTAAMVGASGSGKSTIVALLERFYDPTAGRVALDGVDITTLNVQWLRAQIGLVSQEPTLFATDIKGNVAHGLIGTPLADLPADAQLALVQQACVTANADGFIRTLPQGYDTPVGERGFLLSGGQKQRIAIARAIVADPKILLLDEATSALDTRSERVVQDALDKASTGRTTITIAHRLATVQHADRIFVMGAGAVLEAGTHEELLRHPSGPYAALVEAQQLREARSAGSSASPLLTVPAKKSLQTLSALSSAETLSIIALDAEAKAPDSDSESESEDESAVQGDLGLFHVLRRMGMLNREAWYKYCLASFFAFITGAVYPAFGIVFAHGVSGFSDPTTKERRFDGDRNALWFFVIAIVITFSLGLQTYMFSTAGSMLTAKLRSAAFKAILAQDIAFFDKDTNTAGSLTSQLSDNPQKVSYLAGITLGGIIQSISTLAVAMVVGLIFSWQLGLVSLACTPLLVTAGYIRLRVTVTRDAASKSAYASSAQLASEAISAIRTVSALTRQADCLDLYREQLREPLRRSVCSGAWIHALYGMSQAMSYFVIALVFWYGSQLVADQKYSTFQFYVGLMSATYGAIQAGNIFNFVPDISSAKGAGSDLIKLLDSVPSSHSVSGALDMESLDHDANMSVEKRALPTVEGHIQFRDVRFRYPTRPEVPVLRGLQLDVEPGTYVALVGASGCGKSTVIQLLQRFYEPLSGIVTLDGCPISALDVEAYRSHISLVSQEPTLYAGTIRFNILLGANKPAEEVTQAEIEHACQCANILDFVQSLPRGFDTEVGGKGSQLSGGQKQRIAIARALLRNPKVLLLDEATSALDSNSEKVVQEALDRAAKGRTTIAIAHRLSTIQNADRIYFIKDGVVSEVGTHDELLAFGGEYASYVEQQVLDNEQH
ncbi:P-loop containing nucleoside triphosphate hydrolase protein [Amylocystis lapponica]|nr:P-loop containing nucleoside triphosphate hydrolase protein [Amylocystis lapponica]